MINLLTLEPHCISRDLSGYITTVFGVAKIGKSTFASKFPSPLFLATERGYNALSGIYAIDVTSWGDVKQILRELKKSEVKEKFKTIVVDVIDIAADMCQKYICNQLGIENIGDGGWTNNGWARYKREFEEVFRTIAQLGYSVLFLSHDKEKTVKPKYGDEYQQTCCSLQSSAAAIIENMSDMILYAHGIPTENGDFKRVLTVRSDDGSIRCGSRFKYMDAEIDFSYEALTKALNEAIDREAEINNGSFVTNASIAPIPQKDYNFTEMMSDFQATVKSIMDKNAEMGAEITAIIEKYLGRGKKASDCTPSQCEQLELINIDLKDLLERV